MQTLEMIEDFKEEDFEDMFFDTGALYDFEDVPLLLVDTDTERVVARQKELMDTVFGGIGEEKKEEKRAGLAMQHLDIEQRHALRLLLTYQGKEELITHLKRCLDDPGYGYGERGDNGRTIAQAMAAMAEGEIDGVVIAWLETHREFQQRVLAGQAFGFRSLFDYADLDSFASVVQRVGDTTWRLGVQGEGKHRDFEGDITAVWTKLCDTYVSWSEADNNTWLEKMKRQATRRPDHIQRAAWADRIRREVDTVRVENGKVVLSTERNVADWPVTVTLGDQIGLSRLSGHNFYEATWGGGLFVRRFEISSTTRNKVPFEHTELALRLIECLDEEKTALPAPATPGEVEAAYLRRMKAGGAELGPSEATLPEGIAGTPAAAYKVGDVVVTLLKDGGDNFAYAAVGEETAVLLRKNEKREVMAASQVKIRKGRARVAGGALMTTPLRDLVEQNWSRALCAWGAWLAQVTAK